MPALLAAALMLLLRPKDRDRGAPSSALNALICPEALTQYHTRPHAARAMPIDSVFLPGCVIPGHALDLRNAVIVSAPDASPRQKQAVKMLVEEAEKRTRIRWPQMTAWPATNVPVIAVGLQICAA